MNSGAAIKRGAPAPRTPGPETPGPGPDAEAPAPWPWARVAVTACLGMGLLALAFRDVHPGRVWDVIRSARYSPLLIAVLLDGVIFFLKSMKWRYIFLPIRPLPIRTFFSAIAVGSMSNLLLPLRLDELVRTFYFGAREGISRATVLGTIVVERLADLLMLGIAAGVLVVAFQARVANAHLGGFPALAFMIGSATVTAALLLRPAHFGRFRDLYAAFRSGLDVFPQRARLLGVLAFALAEWAVTVLYMAVVLDAFDVRLPFFGLLTLVTASYLSFALPAAPGALGTFEVLVKGALAAGFSLDPDTAMSCALVLHFMLVVPISLAGAAFLVKDGVSFVQLGRLRTDAGGR